MSSSLELTEIVINKRDKVVRFNDWNSECSKSSDHPFRKSEGALLISEDTGSSSSVFNVISAGFQKCSQGIRTIRSVVSLCVWFFYPPEKILDPKGQYLQRWNKIFLISCVLALGWDPLFFYIPIIDGEKKCLKLDDNFKMVPTALRTLTDLFYLFHIFLKFRTGIVSHSSRVFRINEFITDSATIGRRYLSSYFIVDILAVLPFPQMAVYAIIPNLIGAHLTSEVLLKLVIFTQYVPRLLRIYPLHYEVRRTSGLITDTAWAGAAFNLFLYMLASHIVGAVWYLFAIDRQRRCWRNSCIGQGCHQLSLYCKDKQHVVNYAFNSSYCSLVDPGQITDSSVFNFGLFFDALRSEVVQSTHILNKLSYCFWWGLRNLSSCGQNLQTSTFLGENIFATFICVIGLILIALLIGNMQKYLQMLLSTALREEEMRKRRQDIEQWMSRRSLPEEIRERIRRYEEYNWQETRGVDEESVISNLPRDIRIDIKRHLGLNAVMRVAMFSKLDERLKDIMCDRLKPMLYTENSFIIREGNPIHEMLFVMKGRLMSKTTRVGFCNSFSLRAGDFCCEELLTWALDPRSSSNLPLSTSTIQCETEVEAFALMPDDLKFVGSLLRKQEGFRNTFRFYSPQWRTWAAHFIQAAWWRYWRRKLVKSRFYSPQWRTWAAHFIQAAWRRYWRRKLVKSRFYSPQWRTWAAHFIQAAWRRYCRRKLVKSLQEDEHCTLENERGSSSNLGVTIYASMFAVNALRNLQRNRPSNSESPQRSPSLNLQKPTDPDFIS